MYVPHSLEKRSFFDLALGFNKSLYRKNEGETQRDSKEIEQARTRLLGAGLFFLILFLLISIRLIEIMVFTLEASENLKSKNYQDPTSMGRSDIVDRNGVLLATNLKTASLYVNPKQISDPKQVAHKLTQILTQLDPKDVYRKLISGKKFVWLARNLSPQEQARIHKLGIPGLGFHREEKRVYPHGSLLSHVLGFTNVDNKGIGGVEYHFDTALITKNEPLQLSIDLRIQHILYDEIKKGIEHFNAQGGIGLVLDVNTGEVLAMVSLPDFDPNTPENATQESFFNKSTLGVYEMGSASKLFTVAMALDKGTVTMKSGYDASAPLKVAKFKIHDLHPKNRWLSVPEILIYSSNIGTSKMALDVGIQGQKEFMSKLGLLSPATIEIAEVGKPLVPKDWREINLMTISYGYGVSFSPLQLVAGISAMVNGGIMNPPTLIKKTVTHPSQSGKRVISENTSLEMRKLLRLVVTHGTGRKAKVKGYLVGGKSSTAEVLLKGRAGYNHEQNLSSFLGVFPMNKPQYLVLVMLDRPHATAETYGHSTGGWTSAPTVGHIIARIAGLLGVTPIDEETPEIKQAFYVQGVSTEDVGSENQGIRNARY